jgi:hypothetical protein
MGMILQVCIRIRRIRLILVFSIVTLSGCAGLSTPEEPARYGISAAEETLA